MSQTPAYIARMASDRIVGPGERARLRSLAGRGLGENTPGFDVFTGLWWPLRERSQAAPRREVAWLVAKLYSASPIPHVPLNADKRPSLAQVLGRSEPREEHAQRRFRRRFDSLLCTPLGALEPHLRWALSVVRKAVVVGHAQGVDWVQLTDHLSIWDRGEEHRLQRDIRDIWAEHYLEATHER